MSNSTPEELIAQAREIMRVCPDSSRILLQLADLAEAEGRRARRRDKSGAALLDSTGRRRYGARIGATT